MEGESWTALPTVIYPTSSSDPGRSSPRGARRVHKGEGGEPQRPAPPRLLPGSPALGWRTPTIPEAGAQLWAPGRLCFFLLLPTASISWNLRDSSAGSRCLRHSAFPVGVSFISAAPYLQHTAPCHPPGSWRPPAGNGLPGAGPPSAAQRWEGPCGLRHQAGCGLSPHQFTVRESSRKTAGFWHHKGLGGFKGKLTGTKATPKPLGVTEGWWPWVVGFVREGHSGTWERLKGDSPLGTRGTWEQARLEGGR